MKISDLQQKPTFTGTHAEGAILTAEHSSFTVDRTPENPRLICVDKFGHQVSASPKSNPEHVLDGILRFAPAPGRSSSHCSRRGKFNPRSLRKSGEESQGEHTRMRCGRGYSDLDAG